MQNFSPELPRDLVFVDLETTGGSAAFHRVTEIGIVRVHAGAVLEEWSSLVNPECPIPAPITAFTGISDQMVADAPRFREVSATVREKLNGCVFVAHNARFDYSFLRAEFARVGVRFTAPVLCTVKLSRRLFPEQLRHGLDALIEKHALVCTARHRALGDARVLWDFWRKIEAGTPADSLAQATFALLHRYRLPEQLDAGAIEELPDHAGAYRMLDAEERVLFVGFGKSLRARVLDHFLARAVTRDELPARVVRIEWQESAGPIGAKLLARRWIERYRPVLNRNANSHESSWVIRLSDGEPGDCAIVPIDTLEPSEWAQSFGPFRKREDARRAWHALTADLDAENRGLRIRLALAKLKLKGWPVRGRAGIREHEPRGFDHVHVFAPWSYVGSASDAAELETLRDSIVEPRFERDVYDLFTRREAASGGLRVIDLGAGVPA